MASRQSCLSRVPSAGGGGYLATQFNMYSTLGIKPVVCVGRGGAMYSTLGISLPCTYM